MPDSPFTSVAPYYDALMSNVPYDMWADYVEEVFEHLRVTPRRILDIATGTGSVALLLAERSYKVTGVDLSAPMLEQARRKARDAGLDIDFIQRDAAELNLPADSFEAAICLYDSFNYIVEPARLLWAFQGTAAALVAGGVFVFDLNTVYSLEQELFTQQNLSPQRDVRYRWRSRYDRTTRIATVDMEFWTADGAHFRETHYERGYTEAEIIGMLDTAGFILEGAFEAYTFLPPGPRSERVFYVARAGEGCSGTIGDD